MEETYSKRFVWALLNLMNYALNKKIDIVTV